RKDLAYTYLKVGETQAAREQFGEAMRLNPADFHVSLEYAFLCFESQDQAVTFKATARRIFDRIRSTGDPASRTTAEQAFQNIDKPLKSGIERWTAALALSPDNFSAHYDLATLAEQRDELDLAAEHYLKAWRLLPERKSVLLDLGRVRKNLNQLEDANAALLAASRGGEPRAAELARELLPTRYPFVYEFRRALLLDPQNAELHRELAYLLMRMGEKGEAKPAEAEEEFRAITDSTPSDLLSAAQLGFLYLSRNDKPSAMPLLERVLQGPDEELANRVRAALHMPVQVQKKPEITEAAASSEARLMAEESFKAGYLKDALKYLQIAHEADPVDFSVILKLGWAYNMLRDDRSAIRWFALARKSPDPEISGPAGKAYESLRPSLARFRTTAWLFPFYSSRWKDVFSYGQVKTDLRIEHFPIRPYVSLRFIGDTRQTIGGALPQYLSESSFILGLGAATNVWHGVTGWAEAGSAISYVNRHMLPDYRGGLSWSRSLGHGIASETPGFFFESNADGVFVSRFNDDFLAYSQNRFGYTPAFGDFQTQILWNSNFTTDAKRQYWANFVEMGPGVRFRWAALPPSLLFSVNVMRGVYTINAGNPRRPNFIDVRAGFWYAITH
ncbi:MAG: tetratricopeptide repeat protein, partial [Acidobacteriota bacterium]|nr:tetratricopeptide repeat protein [Acidobacteriota bacterium]